MNPAEIAHLEKLKATAQGEMYLAIQARSLEHVDRLTKLISEYERKIEEAAK
jgi:hypothetical protein